MSEATSNLMCQKCQSSTGQTYRFHCGEKIGETRENLPSQGKTKVTTSYKIAGYRDVVLCKACVTKDWKGRWWQSLKKALIFIGVTVISVILGGGLTNQTSGLIYIIGGVFGLGSYVSGIAALVYIVVLFSILFENHQTRGEMAAISHEKLSLGYTAFWTQKAYHKLVTDNSGHPSVEVK